jgi:hypothetical protein
MSIGKSRFPLSDGQRLPKTRVAGTRNCRGFAVPWFPRWSFRVPGRRFGLTIRGAHDHSKPALWLLPFYPSRLRDDGYDIADYKNIHPSLGRMADFKAFIHEAHRRNLRVITELIINHTSDQHPWFQRARRARPGSSLRSAISSRHGRSPSLRRSLSGQNHQGSRNPCPSRANRLVKPSERNVPATCPVGWYSIVKLDRWVRG